MNRRHWSIAVLLMLVGVAAVAAAGAVGMRDPDRAPRPHAENADARPVRVRSAEEAALLALQEEGRRELRALTAELAATTDPLRRRELQRRGAELKRAHRVRFLRTLAEFARTRGDRATADAALAEATRLERPRPRATTTVPRPHREAR